MVLVVIDRKRDPVAALDVPDFLAVRRASDLALYPSPALLAHLIRMPDTVDEYLLWAISDGGKPFGTKMPAFKDALTEEQIWQIVTYMRAGFPAMDATGRE
jgi:mono/diheme cytochrome c family protein